MRLGKEVDSANRAAGIAGGMSGIENMKNEIRSMNAQIREVSIEMENLQADFSVNDDIAQQTMAYVKEIQ